MTGPIQGVRARPISLRLVSIVIASLLAAASASSAGNDRENWVGTWSTALHEPDLLAPGLANVGFNNQTLRQIVHTSVGGHRVRVRLSAFGAAALNIGSAHIARRDAGAAIVPRSDRTLTFGGKPSITIPPGALILSDPVELDVPALSDLAVSLYVPGNTGPATWHFEARQTTYITPSGNFAANVDAPVASTAQAWFWLAGVDVSASRSARAIVAFGDSLTDGTQSTADGNNRWPDVLARRLLGVPGLQNIGVLNKGLAGNRLLHDSIGANALARFDRDVLVQATVTHVIVQLGGNDIGIGWSGGLSPAEEVTVEQIIQAHRQLIERAHAMGLKILGATLTPVEGFLVPGTPFSTFSPSNEVKRQAVNAWIRRNGEYDEVIDFDRVLRDPHFPTRIWSAYDSGDHGHPNDAGYAALADAIDVNLFREGRE